MSETIVQTYVKVPRAELVAALRKRDGDTCQYPDCGRVIDFTLPDGEDPMSNTIDHWIPQWIIRDIPEGESDPWADGRIPKWIGKRSDWTDARIWALPNLRLMHKRCNAKKGDLIPNEDGTLPAKPQSTFRFRRQKRAGRIGNCAECDNGHNLLPGEVCASCGGDMNDFPRWAKVVRASECDHALKWCAWCSIGVIPRESTIGIAMRQADSTELGEWFAQE